MLVHANFVLDIESVEILEKLAKQRGKSKSAVVRELLKKEAEKLGIV